MGSREAQQRAPCKIRTELPPTKSEGAITVGRNKLNWGGNDSIRAQKGNQRGTVVEATICGLYMDERCHMQKK